MAEKQEIKLRVLVTGASSGIGLATAEAFLAAGHNVALSGRRREAMDAVVERVGGERACVVVADLSRGEDAAAMVEAAAAALGGLDTVVNNAGVLGEPGKKVTEIGYDEWAAVMKTNLFAPFAVSQAAVPFLTDAAAAGRPAAILNVSSLTARRAFAGLLPYCVSKAGLDQLTSCLALELAPAGIRVNAVQPATVRSSILSHVMSPDEYEAHLARSAALHPLGVVGEPSDVASVLLFLATASWITGALIPVDGGRSLVCSSAGAGSLYAGASDDA